MELLELLPRSGTVVQSYQAEFPNPIQMKRGDILTWERKPTPWAGWLFCTDVRGIQGWIPEIYLSLNGDSCTALRDYDAIELTVEAGEKLTLYDVEAGWFWGGREKGEEGWVPVDNICVSEVCLGELFRVGALSISFLYQKNSPQIQDLFERCSDFFITVGGQPPESDEGVRLFEDFPPGKDRKGKRCLGIFRSGALVGILDAAKDYPNKGDWFIGLLVLDPQERDRGLGEQIVTAFETWIAGQEAIEIRLAVVEDNKQALSFWTRIGFEEFETRGPRRFGIKDQMIHVFRKPVKPFTR